MNAVFEHSFDSSINSIIDGSSMNKNKRQEMFGICSGGATTSKPEIYQRDTISKITKIECLKTNFRLNLRDFTLNEICYPNKYIDGFDYSENFDGIQTIDDKTIFINLKCIVGSGGSQTRSLREVYWFIEGQLNFLLHSPSSSIYFVNILDGDEAHSSFEKFNYLLSLSNYSSINHKVYIGDLKNYFQWFHYSISPISSISSIK
jgi:hypothetical protein